MPPGTNTCFATGAYLFTKRPAALKNLFLLLLSLFFDVKAGDPLADTTFFAGFLTDLTTRVWP